MYETRWSEPQWSLDRLQPHGPQNHKFRIGRVTATSTQRLGTRVPRSGFRRLDAYAIVYILEGRGRYQDENGVDLDVKSGHLIQVFPSLGHAYSPETDDGWIERYVVFEGPIFSLWEESGLLNPQHPVLHLRPVHRWNTKIAHVFGGSGRSGLLTELEETCRLQEFLAEALLAKHRNVEMSTDDRAWLAAACALLGSQPASDGDHRSLKSVADSLSLSYDGFRKRFRRLSGMSPARFRARQLIRQACSMMQAGVTTNRDIADALGFYDEAHFSRRFKQFTGYSPQAYRAKLPLP